MVQTSDFEDILNELPNREQPLDLVPEQQNHEVIREVISWKNRGKPDESANLPKALRKYRKQFNRLVVENDILYRLFYDDWGKLKYKQFCVPKTLWCEVVSRLHNSKTAGSFGIAKIVSKNLEKSSIFQTLPSFSFLQLETALLAYNLNAYR